MDVRDRLQHMAEMYDAYGYGEGVLIGGKRSKSKSAKSRAKSKTSKKSKTGKRKLSKYNLFVSANRKRGYSMEQIGRMWQKEKKRLGMGVAVGGRKSKRSVYDKCRTLWGSKNTGKKISRAQLRKKYSKRTGKCKPNQAASKRMSKRGSKRGKGAILEDLDMMYEY
jgi:hypothetical protein